MYKDLKGLKKLFFNDFGFWEKKIPRIPRIWIGWSQIRIITLADMSTKRFVFKALLSFFPTLV